MEKLDSHTHWKKATKYSQSYYTEGATKKTRPRSCGDAPPLAGAPGAAGSGQELTVPPGRSRHAVLKKRTERSRP